MKFWSRGPKFRWGAYFFSIFVISSFFYYTGTRLEDYKYDLSARKNFSSEDSNSKKEEKR